MFWVGVRYRGIALPDIMKVMRIWLDQRRFEVKTFDFMISGSGTLVRAAFATETEATEFAQAFAGFVSRECPSIERDMERTETSTDSTESASRAT